MNKKEYLKLKKQTRSAQERLERLHECIPHPSTFNEKSSISLARSRYKESWEKSNAVEEEIARVLEAILIQELSFSTNEEMADYAWNVIERKEVVIRVALGEEE